MNRIDRSVANLLEIIREQDKQIKHYQQLLIELSEGKSDDRCQSKNFYPDQLEYLSKEAVKRE